MINKAWQIGHASLMVIAAILVIATKTLGWIIFATVFSFLLFGYLHYSKISHLKPYGGYANWVTAARFLLLLVCLSHLQFATSSLLPELGLVLVLVLDGLDGYLARTFKSTSQVGGHFDMEVDAFFVLSLSTYIVLLIPSLWWVSMLGLWRYLYVLILEFSSVKQSDEPVSYLKKTSTVLTVAALILALFLLNSWAIGFLILASVTTALSFLHSFYFQFSKRWIRIP